MKLNKAAKLTIVAVTAISSIILPAGSANADSSVYLRVYTGRSETVAATYDGRVGWYHFPTNGGAARIYGYLEDNKCDGDSVYLKIKSTATGWVKVAENSNCNTRVRVEYQFRSSGDSSTNRVEYQVCVDDFPPDSCSSTIIRTRSANP